jgi:hypothetical protein
MNRVRIVMCAIVMVGFVLASSGCHEWNHHEDHGGYDRYDNRYGRYDNRYGRYDRRYDMYERRGDRDNYRDSGDLRRDRRDSD